MAGGNLLELTATETIQGRHDDQQGEVRTVPTGAAQWLTAQIGTTGFIINWLQAGQDDYFQVSLQFTHRKALQTALDSFHIHYLLSSAPGAGQTVLLDYAYTWFLVGQAVPLIGTWTTGTYPLTFTGTEAALTQYIAPVVTNVAAPANETYSSTFLIKITRNSTGPGSDTYGGDFGLLHADAHFVTNRFGSVNEHAD